MDLPEDLQQLMRDWPLCLEFDLPESETLMGPVIVVVGAYKGKAMDLLGRMYPSSRVHGFEPQIWAAEEAQARLAYPSDSTFWVHQVGLGREKQFARMGEWHTDACSFINTGEGTREQGTGLIVDANEEFQELGFKSIDLMIVNIEGGEYDLLPYLGDTGWLAKVSRIAVQWHLFPHLGMTMERVGAGIAHLQAAGLNLVVDERPTWTYHVR